MMANSDVCITTYLVIDAVPSVHTMSADFMLFPAYTLQKAEEYTVHNVHCSEGVACTAMRLIISLVLLCLVGEIMCPALDSCTF